MHQILIGHQEVSRLDSYQSYRALQIPQNNLLIPWKSHSFVKQCWAMLILICSTQVATVRKVSSLGIHTYHVVDSKGVKGSLWHHFMKGVNKVSRQSLSLRNSVIQQELPVMSRHKPPSYQQILWANCEAKAFAACSYKNQQFHLVCNCGMIESHGNLVELVEWEPWCRSLLVIWWNVSSCCVSVSLGLLLRRNSTGTSSKFRKKCSSS